MEHFLPFEIWQIVLLDPVILDCFETLFNVRWTNKLFRRIVSCEKVRKHYLDKPTTGTIINAKSNFEIAQYLIMRFDLPFEKMYFVHIVTISPGTHLFTSLQFVRIGDYICDIQPKDKYKLTLDDRPIKSFPRQNKPNGKFFVTSSDYDLAGRIKIIVLNDKPVNFTFRWRLDNDIARAENIYSRSGWKIDYCDEESDDKD